MEARAKQRIDDERRRRPTGIVHARKRDDRQAVRQAQRAERSPSSDRAEGGDADVGDKATGDRPGRVDRLREAAGDARAEDDRASRDDDYPMRLLEAFGVHHEPLSETLWLLDPEYLTVEGFEELKAGPRQATFDRATALARDDLLYLRADHPMLRSAQEMLLSGETGNVAFLIDDTLPPRSVILESVFVLECVADQALNAERFLPPLPLRVAVDTRLQVRDDFAPNERAGLRAGDRQFDLSPMRKVLAALVPPMLEAARKEGEILCARHAQEAAVRADALLSAETHRLEALARVNPSVRAEEIATLRRERELLLAALPGARPRLDALRLVASPDFLSLRR